MRGLGNELFQQLRGRDLKRLRDLRQHQNSRVSNSALHTADVGPVQARLEGELLLRPGLEPPVFRHVLADCRSNIHALKQACAQPYSLQTMSLMAWSTGRLRPSQ